MGCCVGTGSACAGIYNVRGAEGSSTELLARDPRAGGDLGFLSMSEQGFGVWQFLGVRAGTAAVEEEEEATSVSCSLVV